jgi:hypothetical protein
MGGTYQAIIVVLTRAVESPRLEPHLACGDAVGNEPPTAIAKKPDFEHWLSLLCASILPHRERPPLMIVEVKCCDGGGFGRALIRRRLTGTNFSATVLAATRRRTVQSDPRP